MTTLDELVRAAVQSRADELALADAPNRADFFDGEPLRLTWDQVNSGIDSIAGSLQAAGVGVADAVAIQLPNVVELPLTILACVRIGAIATPFPIQHRQHELRHGLTASGAKHLVTGARQDRPDLLETSASVLAEFDAQMLTFGAEHPANSAPLDLSPGSAPSLRSAAADETVTICWTSGTTGLPKGVPRDHEMWMATSKFQVSELELGPNERILCPFPVVNMAGIGGMLFPWIYTASALFLHNPIDLGVFLGQISAEQITYTVAPPPLLNMLLRNEAMLDGVDMRQLRRISSGSAPLDPWMVEGWQARGIEITNVFGSNEGASLLSTAASVPDPELRARYFPLPDREGIEVRLVALDSGVEITEPGEPGELRFRGVTIFSGYLDGDGAEFDDEGFYRTGDLFEIVDAPGPMLLRFVDRAKDIVIRGGMNVSAAEVEALLSSHDSVGECAVVGFADDDLGERVGVFVVPAPDSAPSLSELVEHLRSQDIASYKLPERCEIIEQLPRNPVGKIVKGELRDRWATT